MAIEYGFVYILGNPAMPGIYKIGFTEKSPNQRAEELSGSTSCPIPFDVIFYSETSDPRGTESHLHQSCSDLRVNKNREFFRLSMRDLLCVICATANFEDSISKTEGRGFKKYITDFLFEEVCKEGAFNELESA